MNPKIKRLLTEIVPSLIIGIIVIIPMILQGIKWPVIIFEFIRWAAIGFAMTCVVVLKGWMNAIFLSLFVILDYYSTFALQLPWFGYFDSLFDGAIVLWSSDYIDKQKKETRILNIFTCLLLSVFFLLKYLAPQYTIEMGVAKSAALAFIIFMYIKPNISYWVTGR